MNKYKVTKEAINENSYRVCLLSTPKFPDDRPLKDVVRGNGYAVIAASCDEKGWAFIALTPEEKKVIGDQIDETDANTWLFCTEWFREYPV